jgi:ribosomal protein L11
MIPNFLRYIKLLVPSQNATIGSGLSPVLGQFGLSISQFCKDFNNISTDYEFDSLLNVKLSLLKNKTFIFELNSIPTAFLFFKILDNKLNDKIDLIINNKLKKKNKYLNNMYTYYLIKRLEII